LHSKKGQKPFLKIIVIKISSNLIINNYLYLFKFFKIVLIMKNKKSSKSIIKVGKILFTLSTSEYFCAYQNWYIPFKESSNQIVFFDTHWNTICYGKKIMNKKFLEFIKKEKPNYIFMSFGPDDFELDVFLQIRKISPKTKTLVAFGDDDVMFEKYSRYIMLFLDYGLICQRKYLSKYKKEGIKNVFEVTGVNKKLFRPLNLEKKYDVTFIGIPYSEKSLRYEYIKFLKDKGVKIKLFGWGWEKYPEFKDIYGGPLKSEDMVKVLNQSKINLCLSKNAFGEPHLKGKTFEGSACKTFMLTEYYEEYLDFFKEDKEVVMFKTKKELLEKINYYLKHGEKREIVANAAYNKVIKKYNLNVQLKEIFNKIEKQKKLWKLPEISGNIFTISEEEMFNNNLINELKNYDYISFKKKSTSYLKFKEFLQIYSLKVTNKPISCCDYYVYKKNLGDYMYFDTEQALGNLPKKDFISFLEVSQLMVTKNYFLKNLNKFRDAFNGKIDFLSKENTAFVGFPLVRIKNVSIKKYSVMKEAFIFKILHKIHSLYYTKKIFYKLYVPTILLEIISGKFFIFKYLYDAIKDKSRLNKLKIYQGSSKF